MSQTNINFAIFDSNNLASVVNGLTVLGIDTYKPPKRKLSIFQVARTNKNKVNSAFFNSRPITVRVGITRGNRDALEQSIDDLMSYIQGVEKELWVPQASATRKYTCTLSDVNVLAGGGAYWEAELVFTCSDIYGYDTAYTLIVNNLTGITSSSRSDQYNFQGSADWQVPYIRVTYTALTGATTKTVLIGNASTGQQITITRTWAATDVLEVDCLAQTVKINGVEVSFTGAFPRFAKGLGNITYSDNFTTRTFNYLVYYYKRYA
jgi:hypothetical protein